ncbi:R3H domain-containing protein, viridiplantae [Artemisia annua]|uniref:R3H domain-containing protein, viridiplantae n=1 Tax=Artemisia annua TaxID=35608 RepID=A0A2U1QME2_ARTAN|nr:R3H domain-containing protein, viridiplantae [Artemisia annua]
MTTTTTTTTTSPPKPNPSSTTTTMADDLDSWEAADIDLAMTRLMLNPNRTSTTSDVIINGVTDSSSVNESSSLLDSVDQFLRDALQNPRERLSVLRMEQDVEKFIRDPSQQQMEFQQLPTSYLRLAAHRVAQHYSLQSMVLLDNTLPDGSGSRIIVRKTSECRVPSIRLADIPVNIPTDDISSSVVKVAIKQRPNTRSQGGGADSNSLKNNSLKSVEERKEEYNRARARIFSSSSSSSGGKQESEPRMEEVLQHNSSLGSSRIEKVVSEPNVSIIGRGSVDSSAGSSTSGRSRTEKEPIVRSRSNSRVAIFRDREVERNDPDYDRNYDRYAQRFDPGFGFNGGSYAIQPMYTPVVNYNTEFPQLGPAHRSPVPAEHQSRVLPQHLPAPWIPPSSPAGIGYRPPDAMMTQFSPTHAGPHSASTLYVQYPCHRPGMTFIHPHEQIHQHYAQSQQQQQSDASFGLARPR